MGVKRILDDGAAEIDIDGRGKNEGLRGLERVDVTDSCLLALLVIMGGRLETLVIGLPDMTALVRRLLVPGLLPWPPLPTLIIDSRFEYLLDRRERWATEDRKRSCSSTEIRDGPGIGGNGILGGPVGGGFDSP